MDVKPGGGRLSDQMVGANAGKQDRWENAGPDRPGECACRCADEPLEAMKIKDIDGQIDQQHAVSDAAKIDERRPAEDGRWPFSRFRQAKDDAAECGPDDEIG
jgi:hypothetical protein